MQTEVTDPALLAQLNGGSPGAVNIVVRGGANSPPPPAAASTGSPSGAGAAPAGPQEVTDPALLAQLNAPAPDTSLGGWISQGLSGLNEGIAKGLGAPVDLATAAINLGTSGINKVAGTDIPHIQHPFGGSDTFEQVLAPTIAAPSTDPGQQFVRRVGQELGSYAVPGAGFAAKTAKPLATMGAELASGLAAGTGAATAQQIAPNNPWAELAGELAGGFTPGTVMKALGRATSHTVMPTVEELQNAKNAAYDAADQSGVRYSAPAFRQMAAQTVKSAIDDKLSSIRHPKSASMLGDLAMMADRGTSPTLTELDQLRQVVHRDLVKPSYTNPDASAEAHFGRIMIDKIDELIGKPGTSHIVSGNPAEGAALITTARALNTRLRKFEIVNDAIERAKLQAAASGSGGNINNALRQQFKSILTSPKKLRAFTPKERAAIAELVKQNRTDDLLRFLGKFSPTGNGLMGMGEIGLTAISPHAAVLPIGGMVAKTIADARTVGKAERLARDVAGGPAPRLVKPAPSAAQIAAARAQLLTELENITQPDQRKPLQITVAGGAR